LDGKDCISIFDFDLHFVVITLRCGFEWMIISVGGNAVRHYHDASQQKE
jgi:hypothetical protein